MTGFFSVSLKHFRLMGDPQPQWRRPQLGALTAMVAHWSLNDADPCVLSIPTGSGKTAIALAAPFLRQEPPKRVLVVAPSVAVREQLVKQFESQAILQQIGALSVLADQDDGIPVPSVGELSGLPDSWESLLDYDVVVALPNSISPMHFDEAHQPPLDLFDMIVIDEAHHAPADTWKAILDHFGHVPSVLLTATPIRRDRKRIPGRLVYHYPVRRALAEGIFQPVEARLLPMPATQTRANSDALIADEVLRIFHSEAHGNSTLMIRAGSIQRLQELSAIYETKGLALERLHNRVSPTKQKSIIERLRLGDTRAVAVVGMLGEGFDLPSMRIVAYHDKHKSLPATIQLIGRLARASEAFPQQSVLVTVRDEDVFPELKGVVRELYQEDPDWSVVLPGVIDDEIVTILRDREFAESFTTDGDTISPSWLHPLRRSVVLEVSDPNWEPPFHEEALREEFQQGSRIGRGIVRLSAVTEDRRFLALVVETMEQPKWSSEPSLTDRRFDLHVVAFRRSARVDLPSLVFLNTEAGTVNYLMEHLGINEIATALDPDRVSKYLDSLERRGVSSVGVKATAAANRGTTAYKNFMGSNVDRGLRASDVAGAALGHAMLQFNDGGQSSTAGASTAKGKLWVTRYASLRDYDEWIDDTAARLWFDFGSPSGPLLPNVNRGQRLTEWPDSLLVAAELHPALSGQSWSFALGEGITCAIEDVELHVAQDPTGTFAVPGRAVNERVEFVAVRNDRNHGTQHALWHGCVDTAGQTHSLSAEIEIRRGYSEPRNLSKLLTEFPPTLYFADGTTTSGPVVYRNRRLGFMFPPDGLVVIDWTGVDVTAETRATAAGKGHGLQSIHERLESHLRNVPRAGKHRWIICNDGSGEIADYLVIEVVRSGEIKLGLWHAKFGAGQPSVRIEDVQVVVAQALRSRRWFTDSRLWAELCARLVGESSPRATLVDGSDDPRRLLVYLGYDPHNGGRRRHSWRRRTPIILSEVGIVQPGLSGSQHASQLAQRTASALGVQELIELFADVTLADGRSGSLIVSA
ncbi:MAG: helicase [Anaerolinea sp.]|nr:helicase [Anaerolinea sp.]